MAPKVSNADLSNPGSFSAAALARAALRLLPLVLGACAEIPTEPVARAAYDEANDPAEPTNRVIFAGNQWVDRNALQPVARTYEGYVPGSVRKGLHNFAANLNEPAIAMNDALQGNFGRAWTATQRFAVNSTIGGVGLFDVATDWDLPSHEADFGQTLGVWGIGSGPSVQLPLLGPSNVRDAVGTAVGFVTDPLSFVPGGTMQAIQMSGSAVSVVDGRAEMLNVTDDLEKNSLDYYVVLRSAHAQRRAALIEESMAEEPLSSTELDPAISLPDGKSAPVAP